MTVHIAPEAVLLLIIGCVTGLAVYKHTAQTHAGSPNRGDLVGAIGVTVGVTTVLALLLGVEGAGAPPQDLGPTPVPTATTTAELPSR